MIGNTRYPGWIVLQLLQKCNLRCKMCYEWGQEGAYRNETKTAQLDYEVIKRIIYECKEVKPYYDFFGGEPLLYPQIAEVLEEVRYYGSVADIPTNGTLLSEHAGMLVDTQPNRIWVSVDGPGKINDIQRGKGVFEKAVEGLERVFEIRESRGQTYPKIGVSCIVTPTNYLHIEELFTDSLNLDMLDHISIEAQLFLSRRQCEDYRKVLNEEFGVDSIKYAQGMMWDKEEFKTMDFAELTRQIKTVQELCREKGVFLIVYPKVVKTENLKKYFTARFDEMDDRRMRCALPWLYAEITAQGDVAPCHTYYDLTFGNVNEQSLGEIWNSEDYKKFRTYMKRHMLPICTACSRYYAYHTKSQIITG